MQIQSDADVAKEDQSSVFCITVSLMCHSYILIIDHVTPFILTSWLVFEPVLYLIGVLSTQRFRKLGILVLER